MVFVWAASLYIFSTDEQLVAGNTELPAAARILRERIVLIVGRPKINRLTVHA